MVIVSVLKKIKKNISFCADTFIYINKYIYLIIIIKDKFIYLFTLRNKMYLSIKINIDIAKHPTSTAAVVL